VKQIRKRLTYANVMSSIAVFLVLGGATALAAGQLGKNTVGTKQLKKNSVTSAKIKNGAVTGTKVNLATLGTVPSATNATNAENAKNADNAKSAVNASQLGGTPAANYVKGPLEAVHLVGAPGEPAFENGCENFGGEFQRAGFYKDPFGIVHLVGDVKNCTGQSVFTLPAAFRPAAFQRFTVHATDTTVGTIRVDANGTVNTFSDNNPVINGLTFRTD
jgi:hypothetical protein